jgi:hypothetical protein
VQYRVTLRTPPPKQVTGVLGSDDGRVLILTAEDGSRPRVVEWSNVERLERRTGRKSAEQAFLDGAKVGVVTGALVGIAATAVLFAGAGGTDNEMSGLALVYGAVFGILPASVVGGLIGGAIGRASRDSYGAVPLPAHAAEAHR